MESTAEQTAGATFGGCENDGILFLANTAEARNGERRGAARESDVFDLPDLPHETRPRGSDNMEPRDVFQGGAAGALANHELAKMHKPGAPVPNDGGAVEDTTRSPSNSKSSAKAPGSTGVPAPGCQHRRASTSTCSAVTCPKPSTAGEQTSNRDPGESSSGLLKTRGRGVWKKSACDIMAMLKAVKDGEGVCLAAEFLTLPGRSKYPGGAK